ncbi:MAG: DNA-methyltransferase [Candidatus Hodarchaeales archaeon]|jgi:modification methylase
MKKVVIDNRAFLYHGDCLDVMSKFKSESIDAVITSPPFNLGNIHHTGNKIHRPYSDNLPEEEYQKWQLLVLNKLFSIVSDSGSLFYHHKNRIKNGRQITPYQWILKSQWIVKQELIWRNRSQNFDKIRFYPHTERIYWLVKSCKTKIFNTINAHDTFNWNPVGSSGYHPREFPIEFPQQMIQCLLNCSVVLDPFMGSATTGEACLGEGLRFIGIEKDKKYFDIAVERLQSMVK